MRKKQKIKDLKRLTEGNVEREVRSSDRALIFFLSIDSKPIKKRKIQIMRDSYKDNEISEFLISEGKGRDLRTAPPITR